MIKIIAEYYDVQLDDRIDIKLTHNSGAVITYHDCLVDRVKRVNDDTRALTVILGNGETFHFDFDNLPPGVVFFSVKEV